MTEPITPAPPKKNNSWIWFFVFIVVASAAVAGIMIWFNSSIQLTPEALEAASKRWQEAKITNYDLVYKKRLNNDEQGITFFVKVRDGNVQEVLMNGKRLAREEGVENDLRPFHSMDSHLRDLRRFLALDQKSKGTRAYFIASFDPTTGAIVHYIRSDRQQNHRVEMEFVLKPVEK